MRRRRNPIAESLKSYIEEIIENYNAYIQTIFFLSILGTSLLQFIKVIDQNVIIISLLFIITGQFLIQGIKDSIAQKKLNILTENMNIERGRLFRVSGYEMVGEYFKKAETNIFISGMALNNFFTTFKKMITDFLTTGKTVYVLIAAPETIFENAKLYYGVKDKQKEVVQSLKDILEKQRLALNIINMTKWCDYIETGKFQIRLSKSVFSTSFVGYDLLNRSIGGNEMEIKASFYQYSCTEPKEEPNICIDNIHSREWYFYFAKIIQKQWNDAQPVKTKSELESLQNEIDELWNSYNGSTIR